MSESWDDTEPEDDLDGDDEELDLELDLDDDVWGSDDDGDL